MSLSPFFCVRTKDIYLHNITKYSKCCILLERLMVKYVSESSQGSIHGGRRF